MPAKSIKRSEAAKKAWVTIRERKKAIAELQHLDDEIKSCQNRKMSILRKFVLERIVRFESLTWKRLQALIGFNHKAHNIAYKDAPISSDEIMTVELIFYLKETGFMPEMLADLELGLKSEGNLIIEAGTLKVHFREGA